MHGTVARELAVFMKISLNPKMTRMTQFFPEGRGAGASLRLGVAGGPLVAAQKERHRRCNTIERQQKGRGKPALLRLLEVPADTTTTSVLLLEVSLLLLLVLEVPNDTMY